MTVFSIHIAASARDTGSMSPLEQQQVHESLAEYCEVLTDALYPDAATSCQLLLEFTNQPDTTITLLGKPCAFSAIMPPCPPYLQAWQHLAQQYSEIVFRNRLLLVSTELIGFIISGADPGKVLGDIADCIPMAEALVKNGYSISRLASSHNHWQAGEDIDLWLERITGKQHDVQLKLWTGSGFQSETHPADTSAPPDIFKTLAQEIFHELGLLFPPPIPDPVPAYHPLAFRVTVNELPWPMMYSIGPEYFICSLSDNMDENNMGNPGKPNHPHFNAGHSLRHIAQLDLIRTNAGATTWGSWGLLVLQVSRIIREMAGAFMNRFVVEALQTKYYISPLLKRLFIERYSGDYFTAVLRQLARQGVPFRNLTKIMEAMVTAGDYIESDITLIEFLPQPTVLSVAPNDAFDPEKEPLKMAELVRRALREEISISLSANYNLNALLISPQLEEQLMAQPLHALPEAIKNELLQLLDTALDSLAADTHLHAILTVDLVRPLLEEVISVAYPFIKVVSYSELASNVSIVSLGRV